MICPDVRCTDAEASAPTMPHAIHPAASAGPFMQSSASARTTLGYSTALMQYASSPGSAVMQHTCLTTSPADSDRPPRWVLLAYNRRPSDAMPRQLPRVGAGKLAILYWFCIEGAGMLVAGSASTNSSFCSVIFNFPQVVKIV